MKWIVGYLAVRCIAWLGLFVIATIVFPAKFSSSVVRPPPMSSEERR